MWACACSWVCSALICKWAHVEVRGWCQVSITLCLVFCDRASHWNWSSPLQLDWLNREPPGSAWLCHPAQKWQAHTPLPDFYMGLGVWVHVSVHTTGTLSTESPPRTDKISLAKMYWLFQNRLLPSQLSWDDRDLSIFPIKMNHSLCLKI